MLMLVIILFLVMVWLITFRIFQQLQLVEDVITKSLYNLQGNQNAILTNGALQYKIDRYLDTTANNSNNIVGSCNIVTVSNLNNKFRPYYTVSGNYMIWYDYAVIGLNNLFESLQENGSCSTFRCYFAFMNRHRYC